MVAVFQERDDTVADQVDGGLEAGADEQGGIGGEFVVGQRAVSGQPAERMVGWLAGTQLLKAFPQFVIRAAQAVDGPPIGAPADAEVQQRGTAVSPLQHARVGVGRQVKNLADDGDRQLGCEVGDQIRMWRIGEALDELVGDLGDAGTELVDRAPGEALCHQLPVAGVLGWIDDDHGRWLDGIGDAFVVRP